MVFFYINKWFVYILICSDGSYYTGITNNLINRLDKHNSGKGAKYTRGRLPVEILEYIVVKSKSEALKIEYKVKQKNKKDKVKTLLSLSKA